MAAELLSRQIEALKAQLGLYRELSSNPLPDPCTVHIGDGYFVSMPLVEAKNFLNRKMDIIDKELSAMNQLNGMNEDGLPVFDIVEELDDSDQIINVKVNKTGFGAQLQTETDSLSLEAEASAHSPQDTEDTKADDKAETKTTKALGDKHKKPDGAVNHSNDSSTSSNRSISLDETSQNHNDAEPQVNEPITRSVKEVSDESSGPPTTLSSSPPSSSSSSHFDGLGSVVSDDDVQYIEDVSDFQESPRVEEDQSNGEFPDINPADVLELELMEDEGDDVTDFNFEDIEEDEPTYSLDDADDDSDDDEDFDDSVEWEGGSLFPQDEATRKLIEAHLAQQNQPLNEPDGENSHSKNGKNVHVHFAENVDIREFETSPLERKYEPPTQKLSRFRIARHSPKSVTPLGRPNAGVSRTTGKSPNPASAAVAAAAAVSKNMHSNSSPSGPASKPIVERNPPNQHSSGSASSPSRDPTKRRNITIPLRKASIPHHDGVKHMAQSAREPVEHETPSLSNGSIETSSTIGSQSHVNRRTDCNRSREVKAKINADSEKYFNDSFVPDDQFLELHDVDSKDRSSAVAKIGQRSQSPLKSDQNYASVDTVTAKKKQSENKDIEEKPVLSSVFERLEAAENDADDDNDDDTSNEVNMTEIKQEYQRLRQKLIYESGGFKKKESEKAIEQTSPNGEPKKVSRFKAARII